MTILLVSFVSVFDGGGQQLQADDPQSRVAFQNDNGTVTATLDAGQNVNAAYFEIVGPDKSMVPDANVTGGALSPARRLPVPTQAAPPSSVPVPSRSAMARRSASSPSIPIATRGPSSRSARADRMSS